MWHVFGSSVQGASHLRTNIPNQDAIDWLAWHSRDQQFITLALADGHGNARYFRSGVGAQQAVEVAKILLKELGRAYSQSQNLTALKEMAQQQLPQIFVRQWNDAIDRHLAATPFTTQELEKLSPDFQARLTSNPRLAYGTTLVATLLTQTFILYIQLGDGDILTVDEAGHVTKAPLVVDPHLTGNTTTSLCMTDAWRFMRTYLQPLSEHTPAMLMLSTDGYANSFEQQEGFLAAAKDIFAIVREERDGGVSALRTNLPDWLRATSDGGSGDDISVGIIYRTVH
ncbi:MAG: PP2C family serine/threonine-protein phosphatase [Chloroflexi bacterium]|nr:PP2C family serine/threonine-protein phosphatase [Chloroflexota bacterium]